MEPPEPPGLHPVRSTTQLRREVIANLISTLSQLYGNRFLKATDDAVKIGDIWQYFLRKEAETDIRAAIGRLPELHPKHPPTVGEFLGVLKLVRKKTRQADPVCPRCRGHYASQHHADECGDGEYHHDVV